MTESDPKRTLAVSVSVQRVAPKNASAEVNGQAKGHEAAEPAASDKQYGLFLSVGGAPNCARADALWRRFGARCRLRPG
jgi:hypothetical protein